VNETLESGPATLVTASPSRRFSSSSLSGPPHAAAFRPHVRDWPDTASSWPSPPRSAGRVRSPPRKESAHSMRGHAFARDVRVLDPDGQLLRQLTLDPSRDYQRQLAW